MLVRITSVTSGVLLMGKTMRQKVPKGDAPSSLAASSSSLGMLRKNCRKKKTAKGVIKKKGATIP